MKLTFYGGINEIGGNKILLEEKNTAVFLDFGKGYKESSLFFEEFLNARTVHGIKDYLELDLIPKKEGIYRKDLIKILRDDEIDFFPHQHPSVDAILLSHGHLDHSGYTSFLDETIPVYLSRDSQIVMEALKVIRPPSLENEILEISYPHYLDCKKRKRIKRKIEVIQKEAALKIKDLTVYPIFIDHSIPGALMYLIKGKKEKILYSGDFRLSEILDERLKKICEFLKNEKIDFFLCEGTRVLDQNILKEGDVYLKAKKIVEEIEGLVVADYSMADVVRFKTLAKIARDTKRRIAVPYNYFGYLTLLAESGLAIEGIDDVALYGKKKASLKKWEKDLLGKYNHIEAKEIRENHRRYLVVLNFFQIQELIDLKPDNKSYFLRAITEPHSEEMELSEERFANWIKHFNMKGLTPEGKFERAHVSGHISGKEIGWFIENIKPRAVIPIHTNQPEEFKKFHQKVILLEKGECLNLS